MREPGQAQCMRVPRIRCKNAANHRMKLVLQSVEVGQHCSCKSIDGYCELTSFAFLDLAVDDTNVFTAVRNVCSCNI